MMLWCHLEVLGEFGVGEEGENALNDVSEVDIKCMSINNGFTTSERWMTGEFCVNKCVKLTDI